MKLVKWLWGYIQHLLFGRYKCVVVDDVPDVLKNTVLYLVNDEGHEWLAVLLCPCGCSEKIYLNLLAESRPCWRVGKSGGDIPTIAPSIWRTTGCKSHFFIRHGCIIWS